MYKRRACFSAAIALTLAASLSGCGSTPANTSLYSTKQPVVSRSNYVMDLSANAGGLPIPEQQRLAAWFETLDLGYGDRVAIEGAVVGSAAKASIADIAGHHGILLSDGAPVTEGYIDPGAIRVVVTRSRATVPGCPDWDDKYASHLNNRTSNNFGCATNGNLAAMVANPEHLLKGAEATGDTVVMSSNKAIATYRKTEPTGAGGLPAVSSKGE